MSDTKKQNYLKLFSQISEAKAEELARKKNDEYRAGNPSISDATYDLMMEVGAEMYPDNAWFNQQEVEPEPELVEGKTVTLPQRMLSTNKAYSHKEIEKWANDVIAVGKGLGMQECNIFFRVTSKLDGFAAFDDGSVLYTRGDGRSGTDITRAFDRGLQPSHKKRGCGPGEIVVDKEYFKLELADKYENSRNIIAAVIKEGELDPEIKVAIGLGGVCFHPFSDLNGWLRNKDDLLKDLEDIWECNLKSCAFDTDGLVIEAVDNDIKKLMGHTSHHHRWQIAFKKNEEFHDIKVIGIIPQTSKNGRITPVVKLEPTKVSGVTISRATGHHYGAIIAKGIGIGAIVRVCRSGLVIPYIESVIVPVSKDSPDPSKIMCPSCRSETEMDGDNLMCTNTETCPAQIEGRIEFFFKTIGNCDGFGPKVIEQLCGDGNKSVGEIYTMTKLCFSRAGFGGKTCDNLFEELKFSRQRPIEDWRFLAAFSIHNIGKGGCEKLLKHHRLADVFDLTAEDVTCIDGFAEKSANSLIRSLINIKPQFDALMAMGFNLAQTPLASEKGVSSPIAGKTIVFTGSMAHGKRDDMEKQAKLLGAKVGSSVSSKTDYLVIGANVGAAKTTAAEKHGVNVITEDDYLAMLKGVA